MKFKLALNLGFSRLCCVSISYWHVLSQSATQGIRRSGYSQVTICVVSDVIGEDYRRHRVEEACKSGAEVRNKWQGRTHKSSNNTVSEWRGSKKRNRARRPRSSPDVYVSLGGKWTSALRDARGNQDPENKQCILTHRQRVQPPRQWSPAPKCYSPHLEASAETEFLINLSGVT